MNKEELALKARDYVQQRPKLLLATVKIVTSLSLIISFILLPYTLIKNNL
jgi:hypothetical protein